MCQVIQLFILRCVICQCFIVHGLGISSCPSKNGMHIDHKVHGSGLGEKNIKAGYLAPHAISPVGQHTCPWVIYVSTGQRVSLSLINLRRNQPPTPDGGDKQPTVTLGHSHCLTSIVIGDVTAGRVSVISVCENGSDRKVAVTHEKHLLTTTGSVVRVHVTGGDDTWAATSYPPFIIQYSG